MGSRHIGGERRSRVDDVIDIALTAVASGPSYTNVTVLGDNVNANDQLYNQVFPYSGTPHSGTLNRKDPAALALTKEALREWEGGFYAPQVLRSACQQKETTAMSLHVLSYSQLWLCMVLMLARVVVDAGISWSAPGVASTVPPLPGAERPLLHAPTPSSSRTDHAIDSWTSKVQHNAQDDYAWVQLGDAWRQKARETVDAQVQGVVAAYAEFLHKPNSIKPYGNMSRC